MDFQSDGKKGTGDLERRPGDWVCSSCGQLNFKSRDKCFRGCPVFRPVEPKPEGDASAGQYDQAWRERERGFKQKTDLWGRPVKATQQPRRPGDWICPKCKVLNYTSRQQCFKCNIEKPASAHSGPPMFNSGGVMWGEPRNSGGSMYYCPNCPCPRCNGPKRGMEPSFRNPFRERAGGANMARQSPYNPFSSSGPFGGNDRRPGDWDCPSCRGHNYADKKACFRCGIEKPADFIEERSNGMGYSGGYQRRRNLGGDRRPGDWDCPSCNAHNYASKTSCFICKKPKPEAIEKPAFGRGGRGQDRRPGDWDCPKCQAHNYADKTACFICSVPKPEDA